MIKIVKGEILKVEKGSIGEELGIESGDFLIRINGNIVHDIIEYEHSVYKDYLEIEILKKEINEIWEFEIEKDEFEELGLEFKEAVFDGVRICANDCVFCFVSQLAKGMRKTLHVKDEDYRLSYLYGNYTTLSNLNQAEIDRIIQNRLSPLYVSVHTTDNEARKKLLRSKNEDNIMQKIEKLTSNGIELHTQIVLVPGYNDGEILNKTIDDLTKFSAMVKGVTIVPVGLTKYHKEGLRTFTREECTEICKWALVKSSDIKKRIGRNFVFIADEFFAKSEMDIPPDNYYEGFENLENGVGLLRLLLNDAVELQSKNPVYDKKRGTIACGKSVYPYLKEIFAEESKIKILPIESYFWGENITVSGLITGSDLIKNLSGEDLGEELILNKVMLNQEGVFLDDYTVEEIEKCLKVRIKLIEKLEEIYN